MSDVKVDLLAAPARSAFSLAGRVALVTGSSKGLGRAMAIALGEAGAKVAINYHNNIEKAESTFAEFKEKGCHGMLVRADVTDQDSVERMARHIGDHLGLVDILVLNATCDQPHQPIEGYDWDFYQLMIDYFIKSPYLLTRACLPHMKRQRWGRIINIGSEVVQRGVPHFTAYVAAKAGQNGFGRSLATELAPFGITVNMVSPGWIPVERHEQDPQQWTVNRLRLSPDKTFVSTAG
jgi:3-oxoacyl-[acyl-carrier protein] reductase